MMRPTGSHGPGVRRPPATSRRLSQCSAALTPGAGPGPGSESTVAGSHSGGPGRGSPTGGMAWPGHNLPVARLSRPNPSHQAGPRPGSLRVTESGGSPGFKLTQRPVALNVSCRGTVTELEYHSVTVRGGGGRCAGGLTRTLSFKTRGLSFSITDDVTWPPVSTDHVIRRRSHSESSSEQCWYRGPAAEPVISAWH